MSLYNTKLWIEKNTLQTELFWENNKTTERPRDKPQQENKTKLGLVYQHSSDDIV
jgi:hypothetical protein